MVIAVVTGTMPSDYFVPKRNFVVDPLVCRASCTPALAYRRIPPIAYQFALDIENTPVDDAVQNTF